jgi:hypothetical protein
VVFQEKFEGTAKFRFTANQPRAGKWDMSGVRRRIGGPVSHQGFRCTLDTVGEPS